MIVLRSSPAEVADLENQRGKEIANGRGSAWRGGGTAIVSPSTRRWNGGGGGNEFNTSLDSGRPSCPRTCFSGSDKAATMSPEGKWTVCGSTVVTYSKSVVCSYRTDS
jgi:hypothetical protein